MGEWILGLYLPITNIIPWGKKELKYVDHECSYDSQTITQTNHKSGIDAWKLETKTSICLLIVTLGSL